MEESVDNEVRSMEPLDFTEHPKDMAERRWIEFQKVGEVVQEMRKAER